MKVYASTGLTNDERKGIEAGWIPRSFDPDVARGRR
jgi:hypothetical protein